MIRHGAFQVFCATLNFLDHFAWFSEVIRVCLLRFRFLGCFSLSRVFLISMNPKRFLLYFLRPRFGNYARFIKYFQARLGEGFCSASELFQ